MSHAPLRITVLHNSDFATSSAPHDRGDLGHESRADVVQAAADVARALVSRGHRVDTIAVADGAGPRPLVRLLDDLHRSAPDLIFNLCESLAGDSRHEALIAALLDWCGRPYTGSGPLALGLCLRKDMAKQILVAAGIPTPRSVVVAGELPPSLEVRFPVIVKPTREDASVGITRDSVVHDRAQLAAQVARLYGALAQPLLVEEYIAGRELYVSLLGGPPLPLPMHEIDFSTLPAHLPRIVTYDGKWDRASVEYTGTRPTRAVGLSEAVVARCHDVALRSAAALGLQDYARIDLRLTADDEPYVIDVNPNCDLSEGAGFARSAAFGDLPYAETIERICRAALSRCQGEAFAVDEQNLRAAVAVTH